MAARRLAISSLLCADESDVPVAGPSHSPPTISSPQIVFGPYSHGGRSQRTADHQNITPEVNLLPTVHDVVPLSLQSAPFRLRQYTPSPSAHPDFNASGLPASRKSFKEIAFDDYHDQPGSHAAPSATSPAVDTFDYTTRLLDTTRYSSSPATANVYLQRQTHQRGSLSPSDCSFSTQLYNPSSHRAYIDQPSPPCTSRSQSTHYVSSPSRSPAVPYATSHPQSPLLSATSATSYSQPYPPHHNAYRPSLSPLLSAHKGAATTLRPAFVSDIEVRNTTRHTSPSPSPPQPTPPEQFAPTHTRPTLSDLLTYSPPLSRASAASLPHILNTPIMQRGPTTDVTSGVGSSANPGMEGLEALVEAATQERRRLSGGTREAEEVVSESAHARADINLGTSPVLGRGSPSLRASPVADRLAITSSPYPSLGSTCVNARSSPVSEHVDIPVKPQPNAEHVHTQDRSSYNSDFPSRPLSRAKSTSGDALVNPPRWTTPPDNVSFNSALDSSLDGQPPPKRRRSSEQPRLTSHSPRLSPTGTPELTPPLLSAAPAETLPEPQLQPIKNRTVAEVPVKSRSQYPLISEDAPQKSHATSTEDTLDCDTLAHSPPTNAATPRSPIHDDHARKMLPQNTDARPSGSAEKTRKRPNRELTATSKSKSEHKLQHTNGHDDDPHEWLLEHYASTTPTIPHSVDSVMPVNHLPSNPRVSPMDEIDDALLHTHGPLPVDSHSTKKKYKEARSRTRTPTPVALLEEELRTNLDRSEGTFKSIADLDLELESELDLVVGKSSERLKDSMDLDVEDELLSLLDDKPRASRTSRHTPATTTSQSEQFRKSKGAKSTAATELHNVAFDRESMPPPTSIPTSHSNEETSFKNGDDVAPPATNRKDGAQKTVPKKQATKAKVKTITNVRPKTKTSVKASAPAKQGSSTPTPSASGSNLNVPTSNGKGKKASPMVSSGVMSAAKRAVSTGGGSRSRSTSVIPTADVDKKGRASNEEEEQDTAADDRLYCICKTSYDEDRVMIACDRCDEWYHTQCVDMPDLEVDLVDQFICPVCILNNPNHLLKTTYKQRCWAGLRHPNPLSPEACHKPARGAFSKYCSDDCGVRFMQIRISEWGGDKAALWEAVKDAEKREAVVVRCRLDSDAENGTIQGVGRHGPAFEVVKPTMTKAQRELDRLNGELDKIARRRDELKGGEEIILWREKVVDLAAARADVVQQCGWDQRLCFGDTEVVEFGADVLETYEEEQAREVKEDEDAMQVDEVNEWWCKGKKKCDRHAGWQKLRLAEVEFEKEMLDAGLERLTTQERKIRKRMEDVIIPNAQRSSAGSGPLQPLNGEILPNDSAKIRENGTKGKKRKAELE